MISILAHSIWRDILLQKHSCEYKLLSSFANVSWSLINRCTPCLRLRTLATGVVSCLVTNIWNLARVTYRLCKWWQMKSHIDTSINGAKNQLQMQQFWPKIKALPTTSSRQKVKTKWLEKDLLNHYAWRTLFSAYLAIRIDSTKQGQTFSQA